MGSIVGFYGKGNFSKSIVDLHPGLISIKSSSSYADPTNWSQIGSAAIPGVDVSAYCVTVLKQDVIDHPTDVQLSGGGLLYGVSTTGQAAYYADKIYTEDTASDSSTTIVKNRFMCGEFNASGDPENPNIQSIWIQLSGDDTYSDPQIYGVTISLGSYQQTLDDDGQRETWSYSGSWNPGGNIGTVIYVKNSVFNQIRFYRGDIFSTGQDYYVFAFAVGDDQLNDTSPLTPSPATFLVAIPIEVFKDAIPRPYVGPVSADSAGAFIPAKVAHDDILPRDLTGKKSIYGFNSDAGKKMLYLSAAEQAGIVKQIYNGRSGNVFNLAGQLIGELVGGSDHRPADEIQTMIQAIMCCHMLPAIESASSGTQKMLTLGGYRLFSTEQTYSAVTSDILEVETGSGVVDEVFKGFLSYAPFCSVSLYVPFIGDIPIDTSVLFKNGIYFLFRLDVLTGTLSVDVRIRDLTNGQTYVYCTRQTNVAVDIPVMGTGSNSGILQGIASAATNVASGNVIGASSAVFSTLKNASQSTVVGKGSTSNIAPFLARRRCALIIEYPEAFNPDNYFSLHGGEANLEYTLSALEGSGYTEVLAVNLSSVSGATEDEKAEILAQLKGGVFL